jgi:hypothetical protein
MKMAIRSFEAIEAKRHDSAQAGSKFQSTCRTHFGSVKLTAPWIVRDGSLTLETAPLHAPVMVEGCATYRVVRYYSSGAKPLVMVRGLSSADARLMVQDQEASSLTCKRRENKWHTRDNGAWFDAWEVDDGGEPRPHKIVRRFGTITPRRAATLAKMKEEKRTTRMV